MMRQAIGNRGEDLAVAYLQDLGCEIIERNWHCQRGEIDIVATHDTLLIFCEVKTRRGDSTQASLMNLTPRKRERMVAAAQLYVHEHQLEDALWRIDAIAVAIPDHGEPQLVYVEDVLDW